MSDPVIDLGRCPFCEEGTVGVMPTSRVLYAACCDLCGFEGDKHGDPEQVARVYRRVVQQPQEQVADLLAALEALVVAAIEATERHNRPGDLTAAIEQAYAAIDKASGE